MRKPAPHHQDKLSTKNEMRTSAPKASAPNLNSVFSSNAGLFLNSTFNQLSTRNAIHRLLNVDDSRIRQGHAQHTLAVLLRLPHHRLRRENGVQIGIVARRSQAGWITAYLLKALSR